MIKLFETYVYQMINYVSKPSCLSKDKCPAIQAEKAGKSAQEVCTICEICFNKLAEKNKTKAR